MGFHENVLNCGGYNIELEQNSVKKRLGIYIQQELNYVRRTDLEKDVNHIVIIDLKSTHEADCTPGGGLHYNN